LSFSSSGVSSVASDDLEKGPQQEPLSLLIKDKLTSNSTSSPKHWKKSISRHYLKADENQENGDLAADAADSAVQALLALGKPRVLATETSYITPSSVYRHSPSQMTANISSTQLILAEPLTSTPQIFVKQEPSYDVQQTQVINLSLPSQEPSAKRIKTEIPIMSFPRPQQHHFITVQPVVPKYANLSNSFPQPVQVQSAPVKYLSLPQQPAPLQEVQFNIQQLSSRPPFSIAALTSSAKASQPTFSWTSSPSPPLSSSPPIVSNSINSSQVISQSSDCKVDMAQGPFFCIECKKSFTTESGYLKHQHLHSSNQIQKQFSCKYCQKTYNSQSALKMHIRTHTLPCKCPECGKSFSRPWLLQGHMRTHTGEKPFSCTHCTRNFADKSNLRAHLQTHLQNKKYSCAGCGKSFSRMSLLTKHTDAGCMGLQTRNVECVETLIGLSSGQIRT
jgi:DNA-directed RNA polymerase subunit RPC12/RpoP